MSEQPMMEMAWIMTVEHRRGRSGFQGTFTIGPGATRLELFSSAQDLVRPQVLKATGSADFAVMFFDLAPNDPFGGGQ